MAINLSNQISSAIPGFSKNTGSASNLIRELLSGKLTSGERSEILRTGAERATLGGMPGSTGSGGSLFANADLRNVGRASGERQQQGFQDFLAMLQGFSGTVVPTVGQEQQNRQFGSDMLFRNKQADRNFGLQQDEADLSAAKFNEVFGPREYGTNTIGPGGARTSVDRYYATPSGRSSSNPSNLMFKYRNRRA